MGQSSAVHIAREVVQGPCLVTFCDTINRIDLSFIPPRSADAAATVHEVEDPHRFGVAALGADGFITRLIEKPATDDHRAALTGIYYFSEGRELIRGIETQFARGVTLGNEYYLADAINILIQEGMRVKSVKSGEWLDAGTPDDLLHTNARLLRLGHGTSTTLKVPPSTRLIPPVHIHAGSRVEGCTVGPNVAIGRNCSIRGSTLKNTVVDDDSNIIGAVLEDSLVGKGCIISGGTHRTILGDEACIAAAPVAGVN
jgi:glucose-1-phosphate thymidylyltransferase